MKALLLLGILERYRHKKNKTHDYNKFLAYFRELKAKSDKKPITIVNI